MLICTHTHRHAHARAGTSVLCGFMKGPHRHIGKDFSLVHMVAHMHDIVGLQADPNHMEAHGQQAQAVGAVVAHTHIRLQGILHRSAHAVSHNAHVDKQMPMLPVIDRQIQFFQ
jgi:hypothetical protein